MVIDKDLLRWVLLIGATPIWLPFLRALWRDFNRALREDGGLMGTPPGPRELEAIRSERQSEADPLHSEPIVRPGQRRTTRLQDPRAQSSRGQAPRARSARPEPRKPGFGRRPGGP
jgi:hypothetical protein